MRGNKWQPGLISMGNHRFTISGLSQLENLQEKLNSTGKKGQPGAHFNRKSQIYITWLISVGKNQKKLNSMGKRGQPGTHFNRKYQQLYKIFVSQQERRDNQGLISMGNISRE